ncbi:hypothetical protein [Desulforegula conservatrix]|uniref:hypothetical protein n=1 Tax=Desulforegula conservatrix TaxID=153026 RepID=UPI00048725EB|nr:hypothetical protein [Desulforegula conservatrix]
MRISVLHQQIDIGGLSFNRAQKLRIISRRHSPLTMMEIALPDPDRYLFRTVKAKDQVQIGLGYRDQEPGIWKGSVSSIKPDPAKDQILITVCGEELPLTATSVVHAFENEPAEAIVKWLVNKAGLTTGRIDAPGVTIPRFSANNIPVWQAVRQCRVTCHRASNKDMSRWAIWMDGEGKINWGDFDEETDSIPVIATGAGLISHHPVENDSGLSVVESFLLPYLRHSQLFRLEDTTRHKSGDYRILSVVHDIQETKARSFISYGAEYEPC